MKSEEGFVSEYSRKKSLQLTVCTEWVGNISRKMNYYEVKSCPFPTLLRKTETVLPE